MPYKKNILSCTLLVFSLLTIGCKKEELKTFDLGMLGDSITAGVPDANYPDELAQLVPNNYNISNYGVAGACLVKNCFKPIWDEDRFSQLLNDEPDIVTIMLGTNDCNHTNSDAVRANYENDYREMIGLFQNMSSQPRIALCYPPPAYDIDFRLDSLIREEIIPIIDKIGDELHLEVIDTYHNVDDYPENYPDKLHPNKAGVQTLAQIIADALKL